MTTVESDYYAFMAFDRAAMRDGRSHFVQFFDRGPVLELASGRGEFLALLREAGIDATGVDIDQGMVEQGRAAGFDVALGDAVAALADRDDASLRGVFCAHFLEHLPSDQVAAVYRDAARVLEPGGTFVAVVPNVGSLSVLGYDFWRDPTHVRPYDPMVLAFFADQAGLAVVESGPNPRVDPGPPPHLWPLAPDTVPDLRGEVDALIASIRTHQRHSVRGVADRLRRRPPEASHLPDQWQRVSEILGQLASAIQTTQHHLYDLRSAYVNALKQLYPPNEVYVVARKDPSPRPHG